MLGCAGTTTHFSTGLQVVADTTESVQACVEGIEDNGLIQDGVVTKVTILDAMVGVTACTNHGAEAIGAWCEAGYLPDGPLCEAVLR